MRVRMGRTRGRSSPHNSGNTDGLGQEFATSSELALNERLAASIIVEFNPDANVSVTTSEPTKGRTPGLDNPV